ncbi:MAG: C4-type zinc ribbon domain-containing protein [Candidatus Aceula meridiana]|nr:C4-type zinc ribbon domain-containing protein [Candidatus Aceula meridiana]
MTSKSAKDQIIKLVELQKFDTEIYQYNKELKEGPERLQEIKIQFEAKKQILKEFDERTKSKQLERKEKEVDLQAKEDEIVKSNNHLSQLKTNKEYKAKLTEIENIKADKSIIEEKILILFDEVDKIKDQFEKEKVLLAEEEKNYIAEKKQIEDFMKELEEKVKLLENKRKQTAVDIDANALSRYERILKGKDGLAIVKVENGSCTGCYMNVPAQQVNQIKKHENLIYCEMCARILYIEEDL